MAKLEKTKLPNKEAWAYQMLLVKKDHKIRIKKDIVPMVYKMGEVISHPTVTNALRGEASYEHMRIVEDAIHAIIEERNSDA